MKLIYPFHWVTETDANHRKCFPHLPRIEAQEEAASRGQCSQWETSLGPPVQAWDESQTSGLFIRAHGLWPLVGLSHHWAQKTPMTKGPLKLARNMEGGTKRDNLSVVWTYNTIHSTKYVTPSKRHLAPACTLGVLPRVKCACFTSRCCVRRGAAYRSQPLRTVTGLSVLGGHAASGFLTDVGPSLLVISVLALQESKTQITPQQVCVRGSTPEDETDPTPAHTQGERWTGHGWPATTCLSLFPWGRWIADVLEATIQAEMTDLGQWVEEAGSRGHTVADHAAPGPGNPDTSPPDPAVSRFGTGSPNTLPLAPLPTHSLERSKSQ